ARAAARGLDAGARGAADFPVMNCGSSASATANASATSSHGRGLPERGDVSVSIRPGPVIGRNVDVDVQTSILDLALRQLHVFEHEKLRRRLELVNEAADVSILTGQGRAIDELHELTLALGFRLRCRPFD